MQVKSTYLNIWQIAYPIMLASVAQMLVGLTDTAFLARVGEVELGASAIAGVFYFVLVMLGMALSIGSQILMSRKAGENNRLAIGNYFDHSVVILSVLAVILYFIMFFAAPAFFNLVLHSKDVADASITYIHNRSFGIFFILIVNCFRAFYTSISATRFITYSALVLTVSNFILDYVLIFGKLGFEAQGIAGAARASAIAEVLACIYLFFITFYRNENSSFGLFRFVNINLTRINEIIFISIPVFFQNLLSMGAWFLFFVFIERLGQHELAVSNVVRSAYMVLMTPIWGYASAANSMVSNLIGQNKQAEVIPLIKKIIVLSLASSTLILLINLFDFKLLLRIISSDMMLLYDATPSYIVTWCAMFFFSVSMVLLSAISGTGKTNVAFIIEVINIAIYVAYAFITAVLLKAQLHVVWYVEILYWIIMGLCSWLYLQTNKWRK